MKRSVCIITPCESFSNDFLDVVKLFYKVDQYKVAQCKPNESAEENEFMVIEHSFECSEKTLKTSFAYNEIEVKKECDLSTHDEIIRKRQIKRLCKQCLYEMLCIITNGSPQWGSLTGVRPTRLLYEVMSQGLNVDEAANIVQAEFDISDKKMNILVDVVKEQEKLLKLQPHDIDIYIGIPFCPTRCAYCSFPGEAIGKKSLIEPYLTALFHEMEETAKIVANCKMKLRSVYIGGGTPTSLSDSEFERLLSKVTHYFAEMVEFTVEAGRPDTFSINKLIAMKKYRVDRISINPQTMNDKTLIRIGRQHTANDIVHWYNEARNVGFNHINMDVIAGLPGEDLSDFQYTMKEIYKLAPDSLTVHTLALKKSSRLKMQGSTVDDGELPSAMVRSGYECATALGMKPYYLYRQKYMAGQQENVGYAKKGCACLYNVDIMEETASILAVGAGAISKKVYENRQMRIERSPNVSNVAIYIERVKEMIERKEKLFYEQ